MGYFKLKSIYKPKRKIKEKEKENNWRSHSEKKKKKRKIKVHLMLCCPTSKSIITTLLIGWLFLVQRPFEPVFQPISGRLSEREKEKREDR